MSGLSDRVENGGVGGTREEEEVPVCPDTLEVPTGFSICTVFSYIHLD